MQCKRLAVLVCVGLMLFPSIGFAASSTTGQEIKAIEQATVKIRGLKPRHAVSVRVLGNAPFDAAFKDEVQTGLTDAEIEMDRRELVLLGLLKPGEDLRSLLLNTSAAQVVGFYDYHRQVLNVRSDSNRVFGPERFTIAHEYTHALQDQHFHLGKLLPDQWPLTYRNSDAVAAHHALTEGDAVNLQNLFINRTYSAQDLRALLNLESQQPTPPALPSALQRELYFPYTTGVSFVQALYKSGGMSAVNGAYKRLPRSTFEIMHPNAYLAKWKPTNVTLHSVQGFNDWQQIDDDVWGAFGYKLLLWQFLPEKRANAITNAYRGDRYIFLEKGANSAMLFKSVWSNVKSAKAASQALVAALQKRFPNARSTGPSRAKLVLSATTAVDVLWQGKRLTVAYGVDASTVQKLASAPTN